MALLASVVTILLALPLLHQRVAVYLAYAVNALDLDSSVQLARFSTYWQALRWICVLASILAEFCVLPWPIDGDRLRTFLLAWAFDLTIVVLCEKFTSRSSRTRGEHVSDPEDSPPGAPDQDLATRNSVEPDEACVKISLENPTHAVEKLDDLEEPYTSLVGFVLALAREWFEVAKGSPLLRRFSDAYLPPMIALLVRMRNWIPGTHAHAAAGEARGEEEGFHYLDCANQIVRRWFADGTRARNFKLVSAPVCVPACILAVGFFFSAIPDPRPLNGALVVAALSGLSVVLSIAVVRARFARCFNSGRGRDKEKEKGIDVDAGPLQGAQDEDEDTLPAVNGVSGTAPQPRVSATSEQLEAAPIITAGLPLPNSSSSRALNSRRPPEPEEVDPACDYDYEYERRAKKARLHPGPHDVFDRGNALRRRKQQQRVVRFAGVGELCGRGLVLGEKNREQLGAGGGGPTVGPALEQEQALVPAAAEHSGSVPAFPTHRSERSIDVRRNAAAGSDLEAKTESDPFRDVLNIHNIPPPREVEFEFAPIMIGDLHRLQTAAPAQSGFSFSFSDSDSEKRPAQRAEMNQKETRVLARGWGTVREPDVRVLGGAGPGEQERELSLQHNKAHLAMGAGGGLVQGGRNAKDRKGKGKGKGKAPEGKGGRGGERSWLVQMSEVRDLDLDVDVGDASSESSSADTDEW